MLSGSGAQGSMALTSFTRADGHGASGGFKGGLILNDVLGSRIILEGIYRMANVGQGPGLVVGGRSFSHQNAIKDVHGFYN
jgi:hypothetical protein